mgnify:CR=1 FL=1
MESTAFRRYIVSCHLLLCCVLLLCQSVTAQIDPEVDQILQEALDRYRASSGSVGLAMAVSLPEHGTWAGASGLSARDAETPMTLENMFRVGSITKTFVAAAIMQLAEEGVLTVEDPVAKWLPGLVPNGENITIRHLLTHTSGIFSYTDDDTFWEESVADLNRRWKPEEIVAIAAGHDPNFAPGSQWSYSNTGYTLLGMIVEKTTDSTVAAEIRHRFLEPLQMNRTFLAGVEEGPEGLAHGYVSDGSGTLSDVEAQPYTAIETGAWAAGAMVSSVGDLAHWASALYGGEVLASASLEQMLTVEKGNYGFGVFRSNTLLGAAFGHGGGIPGFISSMDYLPDHGIAIVVLANQGVNTGGLRDIVLGRLMPLGQLFPAEDIQIMGDDVLEGWQVESSEGAGSVHFTSDGPVYEGDVSSSFQVAKPSRSTAKWRIQLIPDEPLLPLGYRAIRFAFHPGDLEKSDTSHFSAFLSGGRLLDNFLRDEAEAPRVDVDLKEWQIVEIPLEAFELAGPMRNVTIQGNMEGTFYLDDIRLVAATPPLSTTAVIEECSTTFPQSFSLNQNYPNPFNSATTIRFALPATADVELAVFNLAGQKVATLAQGLRQAGTYTVLWDGRDDDGRALASGVYLYRLRTGDGQQVATRKLMSLR